MNHFCEPWKVMKGNVVHHRESGGQQEELSLPTLVINRRSNRNRRTLRMVLKDSTILATRRKLSPSPGTSLVNDRLSRFSPWEVTCSSQLPSTDFLFVSALPTSSFLYQREFLSFVLGTCLWFCCDVLVPEFSAIPEPTHFCW